MLLGGDKELWVRCKVDAALLTYLSSLIVSASPKLDFAVSVEIQLKRFCLPQNFFSGYC